MLLQTNSLKSKNYIPCGPKLIEVIYMGILNMMIVIPMAIQTISFGPIYKFLLGGNAVNAILFAAAFFIIAAVLSLRLNVPEKQEADE